MNKTKSKYELVGSCFRPRLMLRSCINEIYCQPGTNGDVACTSDATLFTVMVYKLEIAHAIAKRTRKGMPPPSAIKNRSMWIFKMTPNLVMRIQDLLDLTDPSAQPDQVIEWIENQMIEILRLEGHEVKKNGAQVKETQRWLSSGMSPPNTALQADRDGGEQ
jgi:hypothetical protein